MGRGEEPTGEIERRDLLPEASSSLPPFQAATPRWLLCYKIRLCCFLCLSTPRGLAAEASQKGWHLNHALKDMRLGQTAMAGDAPQRALVGRT